MRHFFLFLTSALFLFLALSALIFVNPLRAQTIKDTTWKHELTAQLNLSQVSFSHWQAGGTDALAYIATLIGKSTQTLTSTVWTNSYKLAFGQAKLNGQDIRKTDDEINLESLLSYKWGVHIDPYVDATLLTQFAPGYTYSDTAAPVQVSAFFDPAYIKESAGIGFLLSKAFETRLGIGLREIVTDKFNNYAAEPTENEVKKVRVTGGLESVSQLDFPIDTNVLFHTKLELFAPIKTLDRIVVHGEGSITAKISKWFSTQLTALFINEPDVSPFTQIKEGLSLGISYAVF